MVLLGLVIWSPVLAAGDHGESVEEVMQDIMETQAVSEQEQIDCEKIAEDEWEKIGDAVMGEMIGDNEQHEMMDAMMGGEGSESLRAMHVRMGQQYLGCGDGMGMSGMAPFRSGSMEGRGGMMNMTPLRSSGFAGQVSGMMGNMFGLNSAMGLGTGGMLAFWVLVIIVIGLFIAWFNRKQNTVSSSKTALDILKERYARGEIDKKEFETKKRDL